MLNENTRSTLRPSAVTLEEYGEERQVILADNIREETETYEDGTTQTMFVFDEVRFKMPEDRTEGREEIEQQFQAWWAYGSEPEEEPPTLEERVAIIEEILMGGI